MTAPPRAPIRLFYVPFPGDGPQSTTTRRPLFLPRFFVSSHPQPRLITPSLTCPTFVTFRNSTTASVYLSSPKSSLIVVLPGPLFPFLTPYPKPFFPFSTWPSLLSERHTPSLTAFHSSLISFFHALHSLNKCSLVCVADPHYQQTPDSVQCNLSLKNGAVRARPLASR